MDPNDSPSPLRLGLRAQLALGFAALLAIQIAFGVANVTLLDRLGGSIDVILRENYQSVIACERMKEALERMDSGALFALAGEEEPGRKLVEEHHPRFEAALQTELGNITLPGEGAQAEQLRRLYALYRPVLDRVLATERPQAERQALYFERLYPTFLEIKRTADGIRDLNQQNMVQANDRARRMAAGGIRRIVLLFLLSLALAGVCVALLSRAVLGPLEQLTRAAGEVERGNLAYRVPAGSSGEIGKLAAAFNAMAEGLRELRETDQGHLLRARRVSQSVIDGLPQAVAVISRERRVELANRAASSLLGLEVGETLPASHRPWLVPLLDRTESGAGGGPAREGVMRVGLSAEGSEAAAGDGRERLLLPRAALLPEEGRTGGTVLVVEDVTAGHRSRSVRAILLAQGARDLELALDPLLGALSKVEVSLPEGAPARAGADAERDSARRAIERLREVAANLLALSRREVEGEDLLLLPASPVELIAAAARDAAPLYRDEKVTLETEVLPCTPQVLADRERIATLIKALLRNAAAHSPEGSTVTLSAEPWEGRARFTVRDGGPGLPEGARERLFEPLYQVPGTEDLGVAGLGLTVARDIVRAHGGEIHAEGGEAGGAVFWFTLAAAE